MTTTNSPTPTGPPRRPDPRHPRTVELPVLGIPVGFEAATAPLRAAVEEAYGAWRAVATRPELIAAPVVRPRIVLGTMERGADDVARGHRLEARVARGRLRFSSGDAAGHADAGRMHAVARVAPGVTADPGRFRELMDTLVLFLLTRIDREPVHGAAIARDGTGLVLAGGSGSGKSTLAYAAQRAGLRVLTEDTAYIQLEPRPRVWGMPRAVHLTPESAARFPELAGRAATPRANGKRKIRVDPAPGVDAGPPVVERAGVCVLERGPGPIACEPIAPEIAVARLTDRLDPGFDAFRHSIPSRLRALAAGGAWRLKLSADPDAALPWLFELLDRVAPGG